MLWLFHFFVEQPFYGEDFGDKVYIMFRGILHGMKRKLALAWKLSNNRFTAAMAMGIIVLKDIYKELAGCCGKIRSIGQHFLSGGITDEENDHPLFFTASWKYGKAGTGDWEKCSPDRGDFKSEGPGSEGI